MKQPFSENFNSSDQRAKITRTNHIKYELIIFRMEIGDDRENQG